MLGNIARKVFGSANDRFIKKQYKIVQKINFAKYRHVFLEQFSHHATFTAAKLLCTSLLIKSLRLYIGSRSGQLLPPLPERVVSVGHDNKGSRILLLYFHFQLGSLLIAQHHHKYLLFSSGIQTGAFHICCRAVKVFQYVLTQHFHFVVADAAIVIPVAVIVYFAADVEFGNQRRMVEYAGV